MATDPPRRLALVLARYAAAGAPADIPADQFATACLADTYEVVSDLIGVGHGIAGPPACAELLWPGGVLVAEQPIRDLAAQLPDLDELIMVAGDAPDLPGLVLAKIAKTLHRVDVAVAPARNGPGVVALGVALPLADWLTEELLDLDTTSHAQLSAAAPKRALVGLAPDWHRLRQPADLRRLDPGLEGWEETRVLLGDQPART